MNQNLHIPHRHWLCVLACLFVWLFTTSNSRKCCFFFYLILSFFFFSSLICHNQCQAVRNTSKEPWHKSTSLPAEGPAVEPPTPIPQLSATKETTFHGRLPRMIETSPLKCGFNIHLCLVERGEEPVPRQPVWSLMNKHLHVTLKIIRYY